MRIPSTDPMPSTAMKTLSKLRLAGVALAITTTASQGAEAETLTRGAAIARALRQNPQVAAARAQEAQSKARGAQAKAAGLPEITIIAGVGPSLQAKMVPGTAVQSTQNAYGDVDFKDLSVVIGGQLEVLQPLYTFGKIGKRKEAAAHELRALKAQTEMTKADLAFEVAKLYESWLFARSLGSFFDEIYHGLTRSAESTEEQIRRKAGAVEADLLRIKSALGILEMGINQAKAGESQALGALQAYLSYGNTPLQPPEDVLTPLATSDAKLPELTKLALSSRPELVALSHGIKAFQALGEAEEADGMPDFFALAFATAAYTPGRDLVDSRFVYDPLNHFVPGGLLGVRWIYESGGAAARADETYAKAKEFQEIRRWALQGLPAEVRKAHEDLMRAQKDIQSAEESLQHAKKWAVRASADYAIGFGNVQELTESSTMYVQLRFAYFDAIFRHNVALAELAKATGTLNESNSRFYPTKDQHARPPTLAKPPSTQPPKSPPASSR